MLAQNNKMPVRRQKDESYEAPLEAVTAAVRVVLSRLPPYYSTKETVHLTCFSTSIRPSYLLLPTTMTAELKPTSSGTSVVAKTVSQWFILGDVFGYYDRYLREFLNAVEAELRIPRQQEGQQDAPSNGG
jgi:hypothetical protein